MGKIKDELEELRAGQAVTVGGKDLTVKFAATLHELCQQNGSKEWVPNGRQSRAIMLADGRWMLRFHTKEGGGYTWLLATVKDGSSSFSQFYKGGDSPADWGPARKFARSEQKDDVRYDLYNREWKLADIGAIEIESDGESEMLENGDRIHFVTSQDRESGDWLIYLDARHSEAKGTGAMMLGQELDPESAIEGIL